MTVRKLDIPNLESFVGASVYYGAAITEAESCRDRHAIVVGGANSAGQGAVYLARFAREVTMLVRGKTLEQSMSRYLVDQIRRTDNINVKLQTELSGVRGDDKLQAVTFRNKETEREEELPAEAIFLFVGASPHSKLVQNIVEISEEGFIVTGPDLMRDGRWPRNWKLKRDPYLMETSIPGIFAIGDVRHNAVRRVASSVGQGSIVIFFVKDYLASV
jgi:thioredoxin reductase (NADPH)